MLHGASARGSGNAASGVCSVLQCSSPSLPLLHSFSNHFLGDWVPPCCQHVLPFDEEVEGDFCSTIEVVEGKEEGSCEESEDWSLW